ncbi:MAG: class I SAM-dependent methyltransferase [Candidatus Schekmanbacteria bacterium]|nr:MAG: class I SAM-dependent methyltransferase [Candidatus Schekmanbacteria bacterium]
MFESKKGNYTSWRYQKKCFERMYLNTTEEFLKRYDPHLIEEKEVLKKRIIKLFDFLFPQKCEKLLDIGCGIGFYFKILKRYTNKIYATDISELYLNRAKENTESFNLKEIYYNLNLSNQLPFKSESFDVVFVFSVIHHMEDVDESINEIHRVLKKGGRCIIIEPNIFNPAMFLFLVLKKHERGIFHITRKKLEKKLSRKFERIEYHPTTFQVSFTDPFSNLLIKIIDIFPKFMMYFLAIHYILIAEKNIK